MQFDIQIQQLVVFRPENRLFLLLTALAVERSLDSNRPFNENSGISRLPTRDYKLASIYLTC